MHTTSDLDDLYIKIDRLDETHNFHVEHFLIRGHLEGVSDRFLKSAAEKLVRTSGQLPRLSGLYLDHPGVDPDHRASAPTFWNLSASITRMIRTLARIIRPTLVQRTVLPITFAYDLRWGRSLYQNRPFRRDEELCSCNFFHQRPS